MAMVIPKDTVKRDEARQIWLKSWTDDWESYLDWFTQQTGATRSEAMLFRMLMYVGSIHEMLSAGSEQQKEVMELAKKQLRDCDCNTGEEWRESDD